jgi:hypothetical protein
MNRNWTRSLLERETAVTSLLRLATWFSDKRTVISLSHSLPQNITIHLHLYPCFRCFVEARGPYFFETMLLRFLAYFPQKRKVRLMRSPACLSVCVPPPPQITFEPISRFLWNSVGRSRHWRWLRRQTFNPVPLTIPKWRTFKLLRWMQKLHQSTWDHKILYTDRSSKDE